MNSIAFNKVLLEISNDLLSEQLEQMKFLCKDDIGKNQREKIDTGFKLFQVLMERNQLGADHTERLRFLLNSVHREDLLGKLNGNSEHMAGWTDDVPDEKERAKLDAATEVIKDSLGRNWRKFGRKLCLKEVKLDTICKRHPSDLEETVLDLLKEWRKVRGKEASVEDLIKALRACDHNFTADKVVEKLATLT